VHRERAIEVRRTAADDWALLRQVRLAALADAPDAFQTRLADADAYPESRWRQQASHATATGNPAATFVAVRPDGTGAGMAVGIDDGEATFVVAVWVAPEERGTGLFDRLLGAVVDWSPRERLTLTVAQGNDRAEAAYRRHGFRVVGLEDGEWRMVRP
jgi:GNAT superfamily N-acetyltransferase